MAALSSNGELFSLLLAALLFSYTVHGQKTETHADSRAAKCMLYPTTDVRDTLQSFLHDGASLVYIDLDFEDKDVAKEIFHRLKHDLQLYEPWSWQRSTSRGGRSLLMLGDNYDILSLTVLTIRVEHLDITLAASPPDCLFNLTSSEILETLHTLMLNDFKSGANHTSGSLSEYEQYCHREVRGDEEGYADFVYVCCRSDEEGRGHILCADIERDPWVMTLLVAVLVIKVLVVLFSPYFLPETVYRLKFSTLPYIHHLPNDEKITLRMMATTKPWQYPQEKVVRLSRLQGLQQLRERVGTWQPERVYDVTVKHVQLAVKARKLLSERYVPVGFWKLLHNNLFLCRLRHLSPLMECCKTSVLGSLDPEHRMPTWYTCARAMARVLLLFIIVLPWIIRLVLYYRYEEPVVESKKMAAQAAGLRMPFSGNFTLYLTPLHILFIVCYVLLCLDSLVYGVLADRVKRKMKLVFVRCLRDMKEHSVVSVCSWVTSLLVLPFTLCGLLGLLVFPVYLVILLPLLVPVLAFYLFPAINLSMRLFLHVLIFLCPNRAARVFGRVWHMACDRVSKHVDLDKLAKEESFEQRSSFSKWELPIQVTVVLVCLVSFWSVTFLLMELLAVVVEMAVYTFIGLIVTADVTSQYLSVIFFLFLYGHECFSAVYKKYLQYHQVVQELLLTMVREEVDKIAKTHELDQENTALRVQGDMAPLPSDSRPVKLIVDDKGQLYWATTSLLVFLDKQDTPYTPENFFRKSIDLNYCACPGQLYVNYLAALWKFIRIIVFLLFVFVVVMAFGSAYRVSTTNQLLATVATGFIPFVFDHFFSRNDEGATIDPENVRVQFKTQLDTIINNYRQNWRVYDIVPEMPEKDEKSRSLPKPPDTPPLSSSSPVSSPPKPGSLRSETTESADWEDTSLDVIFDVSKTDMFGTRMKQGLGDYEAGSQTMLNRSNTNERDERGGTLKSYRPAEPSVNEGDELLNV